jgi:SAM-dependent methyltransferase
MRNTYRALYRIGVMPWDSAQIPAPLVRLVEGPAPLSDGVAVDLGCGTGAHARYLAEHGWTVTAVDVSSAAIDRARTRTGSAPVTWRVADVTDPAQVDPDGILAQQLTLVVDNGCLHGLSPTERHGWSATVGHLAAPAATLLIRAASPGRRLIGPTGIDGPAIRALLGPNWDRLADPEPGWQQYRRTF